MDGLKSLRPIAIAIVLILGLSATTALCWFLALGPQSAVGRQLPHLVTLSCFTIGAYAAIRFALRNKYLRWIALALFLIGLWLAETVDLTFLYYFDARFLDLLPSLPVSSETASVSVLESYATQYVTPLIAVCAGIPVALSAAAYSRLKASHLIIGATSAACFIVAFTGDRFEMWQPDKTVPDTLVGLLDTPESPLLPLKATDRRNAVRSDGPTKMKPHTIIVAINESTGYNFPSSEDKQKPLRTKLAELSGAPESWVPFGNAVTNSNATDVSIPSIVTGSGPYESYDKLHAMPFLFDLARTRGYKTTLITSSIMRWANFEHFFAGAPIDYLYSAEASGQPLLNDLDIDDAFPFNKLTEILTRVKDDIFVVFYANALHVPYQVQSEFPIPSSIQDRRSRALYILETGYHEIFQALRDSGRFDDALLVILGDHGADQWPPGPLDRNRLESYNDNVLSSIFMLKPPAALPVEMRLPFAMNTQRLVANLDIAPTIADLLGLSLRGSLSYAGYSLFAPVPEDRMSIAVSTNAWRHWPRTAVAVARGRDRLVCTSLDFCEIRKAGVPDSSVRDIPLVMKNDLMRYALSEPVVRQSLAKIFRDYQARQ